MNPTIVTPIRNYARRAYDHANSWMSDRSHAGLEALCNLIGHEDHGARLLILDDIFPQTLSAFRIAEYNAYLQAFENARVYSTAQSFSLVGERRSFGAVVNEYEDRYPQHRGKVRKCRKDQVLKAGLVYAIFMNNALSFVDVAEHNKCPFVFTLYPGGGFRLWDKEVDRNLRRVLSSPSCRKVIVTQKISQSYLVERQLCSLDKIEFIYGVVSPSSLLSKQPVKKQHFATEKATFDVCFVAHKYTRRGVDKGYDTFVEVAKLLSASCKNMVFHVVGPFDATDIDVGELQDNLYFYGSRPTDFFPGFYANMDIILSPNRPFMLGPGSFDGFPTGACVEAGLCGVAVVCTDPLQQNILFKDGEEIVIVEPNVDEIIQRIRHFYLNPLELYSLSLRGQSAFRRVFDLGAQMQPRIRVLSSLLREERVI